MSTAEGRVFRPPARGSATFLHARLQKNRPGASRAGRDGLLSTGAAKEMAAREGVNLRQIGGGDTGPVDFGSDVVSVRDLGGSCPTAQQRCFNNK